jgi:hypothetical protein
MAAVSSPLLLSSLVVVVVSVVVVSTGAARTAVGVRIRRAVWARRVRSW